MNGEGPIIKNRAINYSNKTRLAEHDLCFSQVSKMGQQLQSEVMGFF